MADKVENAGPPYITKQVTITYMDAAGQDHTVHFDREKDHHTFIYTWFDLFVNGDQKLRNP